MITDPMQIAFVIGAIVTTVMTGPLVDAFLPAAEPRRSATNDRALDHGAPDDDRRAAVSSSRPENGAQRTRVAAGGADLLGGDGPRPSSWSSICPGWLDSGDYVGAGSEEEARAIARTLSGSSPIAEALKAAGAGAESSLPSRAPSRSADLAKLADEWVASDAIVGASEDAAVLAAGGRRVEWTGEPG